MFVSPALLCLFLLCPAIHASTSYRKARTRLVQELLDRYPEDSFSPAPSTNGTLIVTVHLNVYSVFGLSNDEVLEINGWVRVTWKDPLFKWKPEEWLNVTSVVLPANKMWKPDIGISNSKQIESKDFTRNSELKVEVMSSGEARYMGYFLSETPCPLHTDFFPFDKQFCPFMIGTFHSRRTEFEIRLGSVDTDTQKVQSVSQWKLIAYRKDKIQPDTDNDTKEQFQVVEIDFLLQRKPMYHIVLIIVPYCLISFVGSVMFVIKGPEERYGVSLTILLAMSMYVMISANNAPKSMSSLSMLDIFLLVQMCLLVLLTFVIVFGPVVCKKQTNKRRLSDAEEGEEPNDASVISHEESKVHIISKRSGEWNSVCDLICLAVYLIGSVLNIGICLYQWNRVSSKQFIPRVPRKV